MSNASRVETALVVSDDPAICEAIVESLPRASEHALAVFTADNPVEALGVVDKLKPRFILLELGSETALALDAAYQLRRSDRHIIGLFNPLLMSHADGSFFRRASRAGIADFVALPASDVELAKALRSAPGQLDSGNRGHAIAFTGAKGGVGTTSVATSVGLLLAGSGAVEGDVVLCDADLQFGTASEVLGLSADRDLAELVADLDAIQALPSYLVSHGTTGLQVLPSPRTLALAESVIPQDLSRVLMELRQRFEVTCIDTSPTLDRMSLAAFDLAEIVCVVVGPSRPQALAAARHAQALDQLGYRDRMVFVVNGADSPDSSLARDAIETTLGFDVEHWLPYSRRQPGATHRGEPIVVHEQRSSFTEAAGALAEALLARTRIADD